MIRILISLAWLIAPIASVSPALAKDGADSARASYLYVWARDEGLTEPDFLSVFDANPHSTTYGELLSTVSVGVVANAHHTEHHMPEGGRLFMNGFMTGQSFVVDVSDAHAPAVVSAFTNAGPFTFPHSFERLPNGHVLASFHAMGEPGSSSGGLVELDPLGNYIRGTDSRDDADPQLRTYSVTPMPHLDRVVTTTGDMWGKRLSRSVQIWRLSDLALLDTVLLPAGPRGNENLDVAEARVLDDGETVMVTTFHCGLFVLTGVNTGQPDIRYVHNFPFESYAAGDECGMPWRIGNYWIQAVEKSSSLHVLDISDPFNPRQVSQFLVGRGENPHWLSGELGGNRVALTGSGPWLDGRVIMLELDPATGELSVVEGFRTPGSDRPGADMNRASWPHGDNGPAVPHGVVFSRLD